MGRKLVDTLGRRKQQTSTFSPRGLVQKPRRHRRLRPPLRANRRPAPTTPPLIHEIISRSLHTTGGATACRRAPRGHASPPASTPNPKARPRSADPRIQALKASARGFRSFANYRTRILFFCGKLDLPPILPLRPCH